MCGALKVCKIYMKKLVFILLFFVQLSYSYNLIVVNKLYNKVDLKISFTSAEKLYQERTYPVEIMLELGFGAITIQQIKLVRSSLVNDYILIQFPSKYQGDLYLIIDAKYGTISDITYKWVTPEEYKKFKATI